MILSYIMPMPRDILNELKWRHGKDLGKAEIWYVHRGAPNDTMIISGRDILDITRSFMVLTNAHIPFHRVLRIVYEDEVVYERGNRK
jgi:uncharacterized protein (UPF0248 family)